MQCKTTFRRNNTEHFALARKERFLKTSIVHGRSKGKFSCEKAVGLRNRFVDGRNVFRQVFQLGTRIDKCFRGSCNHAVETRQLVTCVRQIFKDTVEEFRRRNTAFAVFIFHKGYFCFSVTLSQPVFYLEIFTLSTVF